MAGFVGRLLSLVLLVVLIFIALCAINRSQNPPWTKFSDHYHKYSFNYPSRWLLKRCASRDLIVSRSKLDRCEYPLEASREYYEQVYFWVFVPNGSVIYSPPLPAESDGQTQLNSWISISWEKDDDSWKDRYVQSSRILPVKPSERVDVLLRRQASDARDASYLSRPYPNDKVRFGFSESHPDVDTIRRVLSTVEFAQDK
jgi:hypothetical protein